jgi:hypothetical protein
MATTWSSLSRVSFRIACALSPAEGLELVFAGDTHMNEPIERAVAIAIESYVHAPRTLSVLEVVRQVTAVFPDQDHAKIAHGVRESLSRRQAGRHNRP